MRFDLHVHSNFSDGRNSVEEILYAAIACGLNGLAITDHNTLDGSMAALSIARSRNLNLVLIPGVELTTSEGHLIALGVNEMPPTGISPEDTISAIHDIGGIAVLPHPYHRLRHGIGRIPPVDAIEVFNSKYIIGISNRRALKEALKRNMPMVAGSDSHTIRTLGLGVTMIDARTSKDTLEKIVAGKTRIECKRTPTTVFASSFMQKVYRQVRKHI